MLVKNVDTNNVLQIKIGSVS
ncbi:unnamed protein product [Acanthoscelides obtectus]|uniref:Uncharacterized protein n=1 Tax=Acanthoscelides obtectus TaxID=200917 RepID=A0A9P0PKU4_ACAOB|nr:unnamed protein product [Acanthoscelides obtectus]CAK1671088.1 hypothetical protein AOBTE_LOCUS28050 [Acanthoscelides obtectus]